MASFDVHGFNGLLEDLERLGRFDDIAPRMMEAGMDVLEESVKAESAKHYDTGAMVASIKRTGIEASYNGGFYMCTRPTGKDAKGVRNMEKMAYLEYGVKGRPATPVITRAVLNAEADTVVAMREVFEREIGK